MSKTDPRKVETYLERKEAYEGGLEPEMEQLVDSLRQWQHEPGLQPRPGFLNELAQRLQAQEEAQPRASRHRHFWRRLGGFLLRGATAAALTLAVVALFALWLASLSPQAGAPTTGSPVTQPTPFLSEAEPVELPEGGALPDPGAAMRIGLSTMVAVIGALIPWLLLASAILLLVALRMRQRRGGKVTAIAGLLTLLLVIVSYVANGVSWRVLPALLRGYQYDPAIEDPDSRLILERPEVLVERQLEALVGRTGESPLRSDTPLTAYSVDSVRIEGWSEHSLTAVVDTTLTFADGTTADVSLSVPAGAGQRLLFPFLGEVNRAAFGWYAGESSLYHLFRAPAPVTPLQREDTPVVLEPVAEVEATGIADAVDPRTSFVAPSDISKQGGLLADVDLREGERNVGNAVLLHPAGGDKQRLAATPLSARATFSPDGQRIAYVRGSGEHDLELVVREAEGSERRIATVDWMTHHWVGNDHLAFSRDDTAYLYDLRNGTEQPLAKLAPSDFAVSRYYRVSPDGRRIAYLDLEGRLWVEEIGSNQRRHIGWDVNEIGWGNGMAWRPDGEQLVYTTLNDVTLPGQSEAWVWDAVSGQKTLLARSGAEFLNTQSDGARLGNACWADEDTVLFTAELYPGDDVRLLAANSDGSRLWDVTPQGISLRFPDLHCRNGYVALNTSRTALAVYAVSPRQAVTGVELPLSDYPPRDTPYRVAAGDLWLVHTAEGDLLAFAPVSPEYRDDVTVEECRYDWNDAVGRFVDPCSGDEWELDGTLNLEHSTELWSNRDLERYATSIEEGTVTVYLDRVIPGAARGGVTP